MILAAPYRPANCRNCNATESGCEHSQLFRGRDCCDDCRHETEDQRPGQHRGNNTVLDQP
jgi:hypothetical protein